jgi:hypothetical protein
MHAIKREISSINKYKTSQNLTWCLLGEITKVNALSSLLLLLSLEDDQKEMGEEGRQGGGSSSLKRSGMSSLEDRLSRLITAYWMVESQGSPDGDRVLLSSALASSEDTQIFSLMEMWAGTGA